MGETVAYRKAVAHLDTENNAAPFKSRLRMRFLGSVNFSITTPMSPLSVIILRRDATSTNYFVSPSDMIVSLLS